MTSPISRSDMNIRELAERISELQKGCTSQAEEEQIRDIFLSTQGRELTELKNLIDGGDDFNDLKKLLDLDIDSAQIRQQILAHIKQEGERIRAEAGYVAPLKVLSDIDDTVVSKIYDRKLKHDRIYPGVVAFAEELDAISGMLSASQRDKVYLSARPSEPLGVIESMSHTSLQAYGIDHRTILTGTFWSLRSKTAMGEQKVKTFDEYQPLFPEYDFVFTGDSGQGDVLCAEAIRKHDSHSVRATFIHDVRLKSGPKTDKAERERLAKSGVFVFDTYIGASLAALNADLFTPLAASRVAQLAWQEFAELTEDDFHADFSKSDYQKLLLRDSQALNAILPESMRVSPPNS